jgi:NAD(P) transhydrogenase
MAASRSHDAKRSAKPSGGSASEPRPKSGPAIIHPIERFDLVVLGSGPGGQRAAIQAAKLKKSVLVIEKERVGGACLHKATIPSKTLREAALESEGSSDSPWGRMLLRMRGVIEAETTLVAQQLQRNGVVFAEGSGKLVDPHTVEVQSSSGTRRVHGEFIVIATGTSPNRPPHIEFNHTTLLDSDTILGIRHQPKRLAVVGAGVIGCEYTSIFARMGTEVTLINRPEVILRGVDHEIVQALLSHFVDTGIDVRSGCQFEDRPIVRSHKTKKGHRGSVGLVIDGKEQRFDAILWCLGRKGNIAGLGLDSVGISTDERGLIKVNERYQTTVPHIYAVGDVIGLPGLAAASAEQGRLAAAHAFGLPGGKFPSSFPYGIYTIPEISWAGKQEQELVAENIPFVVGRALYTELARGKILGDEHGFLKLLIHRDTRKILGVHVLGTGATELVHIGQIAMGLGASVEFLVNNVFNYPTLAEAYKVAAYNAYNQLCLLETAVSAEKEKTGSRR